ncbi:MAG: endolytic transglycosylase MltG [Clostridiales Family XIII bacterium]|jgi:UPF0755 protein|nr:endolytic transglycosylase MltG [Clostridiales Family XIII bacterium]
MREAGKSKAPRIILGFFLAVVVVIAAGMILYQTSLKPVDKSDATEITVTIAENSGSDGVAKALKEADLIRSEFFFKVRARLTGNIGNLRAGTFVLSRSMSVDEIIAVLAKAEAAVDTVRFTIPEGYTTVQIKQVLVEAGLCTEEEFYNEVAYGEFDYDFLAAVTASGTERLEGFLYPDTYEVYADATAHEIIEKMLDRFDELFTREYYDRAAELGMSVWEAVNMASIVEREAVVPEERPIMARVFYNRLEIDMPLQSCATVQYILGWAKPYVTVEDTEIDDPYNTYIYYGLPPTPICNPRIESIEAALWPDDNDYIYFVLSEKLDGSHNFSEDYRQFEIDTENYAAALAEEE